MNASQSRRARAAAAALALLLFLVPDAGRAMVLTVSENPDYKVLFGLGYYLTFFPGQQLQTFDGVQRGSMRGVKAGEPVWLIDHGSEGQIDGKTAGDLLTLFTLGGLPSGTETVYAFSCDAGVGGRASLVGRLGADMSTAWRRVRVIGPIGCGIPDITQKAPNSQRVVVRGREGAVLALERRLEESHKPKQALKDFIEQYQRAHGGRSPSLREKADFAFNSPAVRGFYSALITQCADQGLIYPPGQEFLVAP